MTQAMAAPNQNGHGLSVPAVFAPLARKMATEHARADGRDPAFITRHLDTIRTLTSYFSPEVRGVDNLPVEGPVLVVGNHNCLFFMPDAWVTGLAIVERRGVNRPAYALGYDLLFAIPGIGPVLRRIGALPASGTSAETALHEGAAVVVYPGGDWESCRPWLDRNTIDFGGRSGFVRTALKAGVPIVPVVSHGSHDAVIVASRGEGIARALGLGGLHIKVFPLMIGPPFGISTFLTPPLPMPSSITVEFLPPMRFDGLRAADARDREVVEACATEVTSAMQSALNRLREERAHPVWRGMTKLVSRVLSH